MAEPVIRLYRALPCLRSIAPIVQKFCQGGEGLVTSWEDSMLVNLRGLVPDDEDTAVLPFASLVRRMLEWAGHQPEMLANRAQIVAAIGQSAECLEPDSNLRKNLAFLGTREAVADLFSEIHGELVTLDGLGRDERLPEHLRIKLGELAQVESRCRGLLGKMGRTTAGYQLEECLQTFIDPDLRLPRVLVLTGPEIPPAKVSWLEWLRNQGAEISVVVPGHTEQAEFFNQVHQIFERLPHQVMEFLTGNQLLSNLFSEANTEKLPFKATRVISDTASAECEWALKTAEESHAAIFVRDFESYVPLIETTSRRLGIPIQLQRRVRLLENAFAQLILRCLTVLSRNDVRRFVPLIRSSYLVAGPEARSYLIESIDSAWKEPSRQWELLVSTEPNAPENCGWFYRVLELRTEVLNEARSLSAWTAKLREMVDLLPWHESLIEGSHYDPRRDERAFTVMQSSLNTEAFLETSLGSRTYTFEQFVQRCEELWKNSDVSIPAGEGIPVVSSPFAIPDRQTLIVLGMLEGIFPRRRRENPILSDLERRQINEIREGQRPLPTSRDAALTDREEFYTVCAGARDQLILSYPVASEDKDNIPTFYLQRVEDALLGKMEFIDNRGVGQEEFSDPYPPTGGSGKLQIELGGVPLAKDNSISLKPVELQDALVCPFKYQMRHRLDLNSGTRSNSWFRLRFLPEKARLLSSESPERAERALQDALRDELERLSPELGEWEIKILQGGGERLILEWIRREFQSRQSWPKTPHRYGDRALGETGLRELMPGDIQLAVKVAGMSHLSPTTKVVHLFESRAPDSIDLSPGDEFYYGLFFLASHEAGFESVIEVDGVDGGRSLLTLSRENLPRLPNHNATNLKIFDLPGEVDSTKFKRSFFRNVKENLVKAAEVIHQGRYEATPGPHCAFCDYGELCRQSTVLVDLAPKGADENE